MNLNIPKRKLKMLLKIKLNRFQINIIEKRNINNAHNLI